MVVEKLAIAFHIDMGHMGRFLETPYNASCRSSSGRRAIPTVLWCVRLFCCRATASVAVAFPRNAPFDSFHSLRAGSTVASRRDVGGRPGRPPKIAQS